MEYNRDYVESFLRSTENDYRDKILILGSCFLALPLFIISSFILASIITNSNKKSKFPLFLISWFGTTVIYSCYLIYLYQNLYTKTTCDLLETELIDINCDNIIDFFLSCQIFYRMNFYLYKFDLNVTKDLNPNNKFAGADPQSLVASGLDCWYKSTDNDLHFVNLNKTPQMIIILYLVMASFQFISYLVTGILIYLYPRWLKNGKTTVQNDDHNTRLLQDL